MKAQFRHFFSILILLASISAFGQDPAKPVTERIDTVKTVSDTLKMASDSLKISPDTLKIPNDTIMASQDTVKTSIESTMTATDTLKVGSDSTRSQPDFFKLPMEPRIVADTVRKAQKDSLKSIQEKPEKEAVIKVPREKLPKDTIKGPSGIEFHLDYGKLLTLPTEFEQKAEGGAGINIHEKILFMFEMGYGKLTPQEAIKNGSYTSEGTYMRGGIAYGGEILPKTYLYLGAMYGMSKFDDSGSVLIESQAWDSLDKVFERTGLEASWIEIIIVSETEFKKNLFLGSKWRLRMLNAFNNDYNPVVYSIPGYGRTFDNSIPALNLYVKYRFTIKSKKEKN